jgi:glycine/D-amino acid oxidase-like deaminating enzyme
VAATAARLRVLSISKGDHVAFQLPNPRLMEELVAHLNQLIGPDAVDATRYQHAGTCLYSMSPDGKLVIGRIQAAPGKESFHAGASMCILESGRAFKYASLFGRILVEEQPGYRVTRPRFSRKQHPS